MADDTDTANTEKLPTLRDENKIIAGYTSIVSYLRTFPNVQYDHDTSLSPIQMADSTAQVPLLPFLISRLRLNFLGSPVFSPRPWALSSPFRIMSPLKTTPPLPVQLYRSSSIPRFNT